MKYYYNTATHIIYTGDMQPGDREAAPEEIRAGLGDPLENARAAKLAEIMTEYSAAFAPIEASYPSEERETWPIQLEEARAYLADQNAETPMLTVMVSARGMGESLTEFAQKVMANNAGYRLLAGYLTGQQQRMFAEVNALADAEAIAAYPVTYAMPEGLGG